MPSPVRVLMTGAGGFVGAHVAIALKEAFGDRVPMMGTALERRQDPVFGDLLSLDIRDLNAVVDAVAGFRPTHVVNLAAIAAPTAANGDPTLAWQVHLDGTRNIAQAILSTAPECVLLNIGSGLAYGDSARSGQPLDEDSLLAPTDDYGASKAAADLALGAMVTRGLRCIRFRPFNHTGPGQTEAFVIPAFAMQIAQIEAGLIPPVMRVGNLKPRRDFLDVRDVAAAYVRAIIRSDNLSPGLILNVASGIPRQISDILNALISLTSHDVTVEVDPVRAQASGLEVVLGSATKARQLLDWDPRYDFQQTLVDVLEDCRSRLRSGLK